VKDRYDRRLAERPTDSAGEERRAAIGPLTRVEVQGRLCAWLARGLG
jgi:hypothetical protein